MHYKQSKENDNQVLSKTEQRDRHVPFAGMALHTFLTLHQLPQNEEAL
jgi:hypothetical protein